MKTMFVVLFLISTSAIAGMWQLIDSQYSGGTYYCTYRLQGTNVQTTIQQASYCQSFIYKP